jgi:ABC-2 type transport system permease protein
MNIRLVFILLWKELFHGSRGFVLIMTIAAPLLITLIINLAIGNLFENKARLAVYNPGNSNLLEILQNFPQIRTVEANSPTVLTEIVSRGSADAGLILPEDLDNLIRQNEKINLTIYFWGESMAKNRTVILSTLFEAFNQAAAKEDPINLRTELLGSNDNVPWSQRLLPLTVMIAIFLGGIMLPATSLILEKQERTILALKVTPVTIIDLLFAKGLTGALISFVMGIIIIMINSSWGNSPLF